MITENVLNLFITKLNQNINFKSTPESNILTIFMYQQTYLNNC